MRRALFGGIGLALGVFVTPASGQVARSSPPPARTAKLGAPVAVPDTNAATNPAANTPADAGVTPAGLLSRWQGTPVLSTTMPPPVTVIPGVQPLPGTPITGSEPISGSAPSVTEVRTRDGTTAPLYPPGYAGNPYLIPSIAPSVAPGGVIATQPGLEAPIYGQSMPGMGAIDRMHECSRWWLSAEYLLWWTKGNSLPPLVTTSAPQFSGIPGLGNTTTVIGGDFGETFHSGGRFAIGRWFGDGQCTGIEARFFFLDRGNSTLTASSNDFPVLARPFFNVNTPFGPFSEVVADSRGTGGVSVNLQSSVWGVEANYRQFLCGNPCARIDGIIGYRYLNIKERLAITESFISTGAGATTVGGVPVVGGTVTDVFRSENQFNGGQIGLAGEIHRGRWSLDARATVAFGDVTQIGEINGGQSLTLANGTIPTFAGGLLALPGANIGRFTHDQFAVVPEVGVNFGYQVTSRMKIFVGYNFLYLGNALRPEGMIDPVVDAARIPNFPAAGVGPPVPGLPRPAPLFHVSDFWVQGVSFGIQFKW